MGKAEIFRAKSLQQWHALLNARSDDQLWAVRPRRMHSNACHKKMGAVHSCTRGYASPKHAFLNGKFLAKCRRSLTAGKVLVLWQGLRRNFGGGGRRFVTEGEDLAA